MPQPHTLSPYFCSKSLSENCKGCCGEGFWLWPRRRGRRIPKTGCADRANTGQRQKRRRPEGFRAEGRLASLLLSRRPTRGILLRRASPANLLHENRTPWNFKTGSKRSFQTGSKPKNCSSTTNGHESTRIKTGDCCADSERASVHQIMSQLEAA